MPQNERSEKVVGYILVSIIIAIGIAVTMLFDATHFLRKTTIAGSDCTRLSLKAASTKIEKEIKNKQAKFYFMDGNVYEVSYERIGAEVDDDKLKEVFKEQHKHRFESRTYSMGSVIKFNQDELEEFLKTLPELQPENMVGPQDAQVTWDGTEFGITREKIGNQIEFEDAVNFALRQLNANVDCVYFQIITNSSPDILKEDAESMEKYLNAILHSCLYFKLGNGELVTLDENIIKTWVTEEPRYGYTLDVDAGVRNFVNTLAQKVDQVNGKIPELKDRELNKEIETEIINSFIGQETPQEVEVAYRKKTNDTTN